MDDSVLNSHCRSCSQSNFNTYRKGLGEGCERENNPIFLDKSGNVFQDFSGSAPQLCIFHTCADGVNAAVDAINYYKKNPDLTIRLKYNDEIIQVMPFGSAHKPSKWVNRFVEIKEPYRVFYESLDRKVSKLSDTISHLIRSNKCLEP